MHHKEQQQQAEFYEEIGKALAPYEEVVIFGPTDAKMELYNTLRAQPAFLHIKFVIKQAGKLTEYQQYSFIREHFADTDGS